MNSQSHCELTFLISDPVADDMLSAAGRQMIGQLSRQQIDDVYYGQCGLLSKPDNASLPKREYRVRRLDQLHDVSLDCRRSKKRETVLRRTTVSRDSLEQLASPSIDDAWKGKWFHQQILERKLAPTCQASFRRTAANWKTPEGPIRLTIDRDVRYRGAAVEQTPDPTSVDQHTLTTCVLRMSYLVALPARFKRWIYDFALLPARTSLFHQCVLALGRWMRMRGSLQAGAAPCLNG